MRLRALLGSGRWPFALRASLCIGTPAALGWAFGDLPAGLLATLGAFTALYGSGRPYWNRALVLAGVAVAIAAAVGLGALVHPLSWATAPVLVMAAAVVTYLCNALRIGAPGAYIIVLAGAAGTALPGDHGLTRIVALVLAGGALSWSVHMAGALFNLRGPERAAVAAAAAAIARFADARDDAQRIKARHGAAYALHDAWSALVTFQRPGKGADVALAQLRRRSRDLHMIFADQVRAFDDGRPDAGAADRARAIGAALGRPAGDEGPVDADGFPLGRLEPGRSLRDSLRLEAPAFQAAARVGIAAAVTVALALAFGFSRPYWAISSAVVVLHQGLAWSATLKRARDRVAGTLLGLGLAGAVLALHPRGLVLVATLMALQLVIELLIVRRYAFAVVFVTASALVIASGAEPVTDVPGLLAARGLDTLLGCGVGLAVYLATGLHDQGRGLLREAARVEGAIARVETAVAEREVTSLAARQARRDLQHRLFALAALADSGGAGASRRQAAAVAVDAAERRGYRTLADCWALERADYLRVSSL